MKKVLPDIVKRIRDPIILFVIAALVIVAGLGAYSLDKLLALRYPLLATFLIGAVLIILYHMLMGRQNLGNFMADYITRLKQLEENNAALQLENVELKQKLREETGIEDLESELEEYSINMDLGIVDDRVVDRENHYSLATFYAEFDDAGNYMATYERHGSRVVDGVTTHLYIQTGASTPVPFDKLEFKAFDIASKKALHIQKLEHESSILKTYSIELAQGIPKGGVFAVRWSFVWPRIIDMRRNSDSINLRVFDQGVKLIKHELVFQFEPKLPLLYEIRDGKAHNSDVIPSVSRRGKKYVVFYQLNNPRAEGVVIAFSVPG